MKTRALTEADHELIAEAIKVIETNYQYEWHHIGAAVRTKTGTIYSAVHLEARVGRIAVCGEAMAMGKAISEGERGFQAIVAVAHPHPDDDAENCWVVSPCGMCRELISDYDKDTDVIIDYEGQLVKCNIMELLPLKYGS